MVFASITSTDESVIIHGNSYQMFRLRAWDSANTVNREEKLIVLPCASYPELRTDSINAVIHVGYNEEGKFYSFYDLRVEDSLFENKMKTDSEEAQSFIRGNIYLDYKKQVFVSNEF
jgi:hypothetical protein